MPEGLVTWVGSRDFAPYAQRRPKVHQAAGHNRIRFHNFEPATNECQQATKEKTDHSCCDHDQCTMRGRLAIRFDCRFNDLNDYCFFSLVKLCGIKLLNEQIEESLSIDHFMLSINIVQTCARNIFHPQICKT